MKSILFDVRRAVVNRWFWIAVIGTIMSLWLSIGAETYSLRDMQISGCLPDWISMMQKALHNEFGGFTMPVLSALPFAAAALLEIRSGAARNFVFRTSRLNYICGKVVGCLFSGIMLQLFSIGFLYFFFNMVSITMFGTNIQLCSMHQVGSSTLSHALSGGVWACLGSCVALLTDTSSAAYIGPLCICYALTMISSRFFPNVKMLNPLWWLHEVNSGLIIALTLAILMNVILIRKELQKYA